MTPPAPWWQAVGFALVGREVSAPADQPPEPHQVVAWLARHGIDSTALAAERTECIAQRRPWPHPLPGDLRDQIGTAQLAALVDQVRELLLGQPIPHVQRPRPGTMHPHDQRLLADKPPHHG